MTIVGKRVEVTVKEPDSPMEASSDAAPASSRRAGMTTDQKRAAMDLPIVRDAVDAFGGDVTPIDFRDE